jgi:hypothetical protein
MNNRKYISGSLCFALVFFMSSCITSFNPLHTYTSIIENDNIVGIWKNEQFIIEIKNIRNTRYLEAINDMKLSSNDFHYVNKFYVINLNSGSLNYYWIAGIVKIKNEEFISITADDCLNLKNEKIYPAKDYGHEYLSTYTIARLQWNNKNEVTVEFLNGNKIKNLVLQNKARIKYEYDVFFDSFLITASPEELNNFLEKYGKSQEIYDKKNALNLKRKI